MSVALYTYDEDADALYILLAPETEAEIARTDEVTDRIHVDVDRRNLVVGVEILYPGQGIDLTAVNERYGLDLHVPFTFAA